MQRTLLERPTFRVSAEAQIAICTVLVRPDVDPEVGARAGEEMCSYLSDSILQTGSGFTGLLLDVRAAPSVFGPKTRAAVEAMLRTANESGKRIAVLVSLSKAAQQSQYAQMCETYARGVARTVDSEFLARHWLGEDE